MHPVLGPAGATWHGMRIVKCTELCVHGQAINAFGSKCDECIARTLSYYIESSKGLIPQESLLLHITVCDSHMIYLGHQGLLSHHTLSGLAWGLTLLHGHIRDRPPLELELTSFLQQSFPRCTGATLLYALKPAWGASHAACDLFIHLSHSAARILPQGTAQTPADSL